MAILKSFYFKRPFTGKTPLLTNLALIVSLSLTLAACHKSSNDLGSPQQVLKEYVERSFKVKSFTEKDQLLQLTTGTVRDILNHLSDDDFRKEFTEKKRRFVDLKIKDERLLAPDSFSITYEMTYQSGNSSEGSPKDSEAGPSDLITIKKHAKFLRQGPSGWLISEVQNLKTNIEHQNAISL